MRLSLKKLKKMLPGYFLVLCVPVLLKAQTDLDGIMMNKKNICSGVSYSYSSWKDYWEGTHKRNNLNLGTVSTQMIGIMSTYGITNNLNVMAGVPYIFTHATAGTLHGLKGVQDVSVWLKYRFLKRQTNFGTLSLFVLGGASLPTNNYVVDLMPLSIGLHSKTLSGRILADYQIKKIFVTGSVTYTLRDNIKIDRTSYYTTSLHLTNEVEMPDMAGFHLKAGYRTDKLVAEVNYNGMYTLGGFDIRKNDMPFPSNKMIATAAGVNVKYFPHFLPGLSVNAGGNYVVTGRNVGQATTIEAGIFYAFGFTSKKSSSK